MDPHVLIEAKSPRDEVVEQCVKIEEVVDDYTDHEAVRSEVPRASLSLEHETHRAGRPMCQTIMTYNPVTGKVIELSAVQNHFVCLAELDNEELSNTIGVENLYLELESVGAGLGGDFTNTNEPKVMKYQEAANDPDGKS